MENMVAVAPVITEAGKILLIRAISGEKIVFTKFRIGNGETTEESAGELNDLVNPIIEFSINEMDSSQAGYVTVSGKFDSTNITTDFRWRELGVFCKGEDENEVLFGYCNDGDDAGLLKANSTDKIIEQTVSFVIAIGDAQNVTAILSESMVYVSKTEFEEHLKEKNPHGITAETVGLGKVPNVETNDQTPTYSVPSEAAELTSGEKISAAFGKIAAAVKSLLSHIKATGNVHGLILKDIGAAADEHEHSAADINSGILGLKRGGTGAANAKEALENLGGLSKLGGTVDGDLTARTFLQLPNAYGIPVEIGEYLDFHKEGSSSDYDVRLQVSEGFLKEEIKGIGSFKVYTEQNIKAGTTDLTAGQSALETGTIYFVYE